jgi:hypothetical protein
MVTTSDGICRAACGPYLSYTRHKSTGDCWCVNRPLDQGSQISASVNANVSPMPVVCADFVITAQEFMFGPQSIKLLPAPTKAQCAFNCSFNGKTMRTRILDSGQCYCSNPSDSFQTNAMLYHTNAAAAMFVP